MFKKGLRLIKQRTYPIACSLIVCVFISYLDFPKLSNIYKISLLLYVNGPQTHLIYSQFIRDRNKHYI